MADFMNNNNDSKNRDNSNENKDQEKVSQPIGQGPSRIIRNNSKKKEQGEKNDLGKISVSRDNNLVVSESFFQYLVQLFYKNLYIIGVLVLRQLKTAKRKGKLGISKIRGLFFATVYRINNFFSRGWLNLQRGLKRPFIQIGDVVTKERKKTAKGNITFKGFLTIIKNSLGFVWRILRTFLSYLLPLVAVFFLVTTIRDVLQVPKALEVKYHGEIIGYVEHESDFTVAMSSVNKRLATVEELSFSQASPEFQFITITPDLLDKVLTTKLEDEVVRDETNRARALARTKEKSENETTDEALIEEGSRSSFVSLTRDDITDLSAKVQAKKEKLTEEEKYKLFYTEENILSDGIIRYSDDEVIQAYGLYADSELVGAVVDRDPILDAIEEIQTANLTGKLGERVEFDKSISYVQGLYPLDTILETEELLDILTETQTSDETYIVQVGDTPSKIALENNITRERLYQLNPGLEDNFNEGKELLVHKSAPFLSVKNIYTDIYDQEAPFRSVESENVIYATGYRKVERPGVPGIDRITAEITMVDGEIINRNILDSFHIRDPIDQLVTIGSRDPTKIAQGGDGTLFIWPAVGGHIGTPLGGYAGHSGVDINDSAGNVIASASGTVVTATYSYVGYGNYIEIAHSNGYTTLYAHNTELYVGVGDYVAQGQAIALLGSTGNSTGPHIHFEVKQGGQVLNPSNFIGTRG